MRNKTYIILGAKGLIGSALCQHLQADRENQVTAIDVDNYQQAAGQSARVLINANGNSYRYKANQNPLWDFEASVASVLRSLFDFQYELYIYISTVDVYDQRAQPADNREDVRIHTAALDAYGFHKWLAERLVEKYTSYHYIFRTGTAIGAGLKKGPLFDLLSGGLLHMSWDSALSLIDTATIAAAITRVIAAAPPSGIFNLTGSGSAHLGHLRDEFHLDCRQTPDAGHHVWQYDIHNEKIRAYYPVAASLDMARSFIRETQRRTT